MSIFLSLNFLQRKKNKKKGNQTDLKNTVWEKKKKKAYLLGGHSNTSTSHPSGPKRALCSWSLRSLARRTNSFNRLSSLKNEAMTSQQKKPPPFITLQKLFINFFCLLFFLLPSSLGSFLSLSLSTKSKKNRKQMRLNNVALTYIYTLYVR